jgi:hypothetical protein
VRTFAPDEIPWDELAFPSTREALALYLSRFRAASVESAG